MGENRNAYEILVGQPDERRAHRRHRRRWKDNIKMNPKYRVGGYELDSSDS
jgi:hypothetical protein